MVKIGLSYRYEKEGKENFKGGYLDGIKESTWYGKQVLCHCVGHVGGFDSV